jgi:hypothetical protein
MRHLLAVLVSAEGVVPRFQVQLGTTVRDASRLGLLCPFYSTDEDFMHERIEPVNNSRATYIPDEINPIIRRADLCVRCLPRIPHQGQQSCANRASLSRRKSVDLFQRVLVEDKLPSLHSLGLFRNLPVLLRFGLSDALAVRKEIAPSLRKLGQFRGSLPELGNSEHVIEQVCGHPLTLLCRSRIDQLLQLGCAHRIAAKRMALQWHCPARFGSTVSLRCEKVCALTTAHWV